MAWATTGQSNGAADKVSGATIASTNIDAAVGDVILVGVVFDNLSASLPTVTSISKQAGETASWVLLGKVDSLITAGTAARGEIWGLKTTVAWTFHTLTATLSGVVTAKTIAHHVMSGGSLNSRNSSLPRTGVSGAGTSARSQSETGILNGDLAVGLAVGESTSLTTDTDTTNGSWISNPQNTTGGSAATNVCSEFQYKIVNADGTQTFNSTVQDGGVVIIALQPGGANLTETPTDAEGLTDTPAFVQDHGKVQSDNEGLTDTVIIVAQEHNLNPLADAEGLTDSYLSNITKTQDSVDSLELTDVSTLQLGDLELPVDPIGVTDTATIVTLIDIEPQDDLMGLSDSIQLQLSDIDFISDPLDLTDTSLTEIVSNTIDSIGLTDVVQTQLSDVETRIDTLALSDESTVVTLIDIEPNSDNIGLSDSLQIEIADSELPVDLMGISDSSLAEIASNKIDNFDLSDSVQVQVTNSESVIDNLELSDMVQVSASDTHPHVDSEDLSDLVVSSLGIDNIQTDSEDVTDSAVIEENHLIVRADSEELTDSAVISQTYGVATSDDETLTDTSSVEQTLGHSSSESLGITDSVNIVVSQFVASLDSVDLSDTSTVTQTHELMSIEDSGLSDSIAIQVSDQDFISDLVSVSDSSSVTQGQTEFVSDSESLSDSVTIRLDRVINSQDSLTLSDDVSHSLSGADTFVDDIALSDSSEVTLFAAYQEARADDEIISDSPIVSVTYQRSTQEALSLSDSANIQVYNPLVTRSDSESLSDSRITALNYTIPSIDSANLTDEAVIQLPTHESVTADDTCDITDEFTAVLVSSGLYLLTSAGVSALSGMVVINGSWEPTSQKSAKNGVWI